MSITSALPKSPARRNRSPNSKVSATRYVKECLHEFGMSFAPHVNETLKSMGLSQVDADRPDRVFGRIVYDHKAPGIGRPRRAFKGPRIEFSGIGSFSRQIHRPKHPPLGPTGHAASHAGRERVRVENSGLPIPQDVLPRRISQEGCRSSDTRYPMESLYDLTSHEKFCPTTASAKRLACRQKTRADGFSFW